MKGHPFIHIIIVFAMLSQLQTAQAIDGSDEACAGSRPKHLLMGCADAPTQVC